MQPTNIMLHISEKKTIPVDLCGPIRRFITFNWSGREAKKHENDLQELKNLRYHLENPGKQRAPLTRELILQKYYRALCVVETLFPIFPAMDRTNTLTFTWYDAFSKRILKVGKKASQQNIHLEKAAVLFNLGAVYNKIGRSYDRSTEKGRLHAVEAFTRAAGVFAYLKDNAAPEASMGWSATVDLSVECAVMLEKLMLAQAQECEFENTMAEGSSLTECAMISRQVGLYYEEALAALKVEPLVGRIDKDWMSHVQLKAAFFNAEACYRYGLELHKKDEVGKEIARLKSGISALEEAKKSSKGRPAELFGAIKKLKANIQRSLDVAVADYESRFYHMRVPSPDSLSSLPSFSTVKPTLMDEVLDARNEKMFSGLARRVPVRSESDVYGQPASNLVAGSSLEGSIQELLQIGGGTRDADTALRALRAAHGNLARDVEYLCWGIREQPEVPPVTRVPPGAQAANPPAQPAQPAQSARGRLPSAMRQAVTVTPKEHEAIERLAALGFDPAIARGVYFACDKNEVLAANNLLDMKYKD